MGRDFSPKPFQALEKLGFTDRMRAFLILTAILEQGLLHGDRSREGK